MQLHYPAPPAEVPAEVTQPSEAFAGNIRKVIFAIALFALVYLAMVLIALWLTIWCFSLGWMLIRFSPSFWTLLIGGGIMSMGGMVMFFLIKFIFTGSGGNETHGIELREEDEPELFDFIRRVAEDVGTHFPRKIYLIPEVNASVFHSSSFWSLFFTVRKNLNIGLGLVNSLNVSEFKSVLAHEFGHFSQESMRLGSYVYYVNQAIYNMLYQNTGWAGAVETIAGVHAILAMFAQIAVWIVMGIQWVLQRMYGFINRQYLSLSREMEFHADAVAASVAGSNNMIQALRQVTIGSQTYQQTIERCNELLNRNTAPANFYSSQLVVTAHFARSNELQLNHGVPVATRDFLERQRQARVVFKNQWASHPTEEEREASLQAIGLQAEVDDAPAWVLFRQSERWQQELTRYLYREVKPSGELKVLETPDFGAQYEADMAKFQLPAVFNGYYNSHYLAETDLEAIRLHTTPETFEQGRLDALFRENLSANMGMIQNDINTLQAIIDGQIDTQTFDFDGQKQPKSEAETVKTQLEAELAELQAEQGRRDAEALRFFYALGLAAGNNNAERLLHAYRELYILAALKKRFDTAAQETYFTVHHLSANDFEIPPNDLAGFFQKVKQVNEPELRTIFRDMVEAGWPAAELREKLETFLSTAVEYQYGNVAHRGNLEKLILILNEAGPALGVEYFQRLKTMTEIQAGLVPAA
ncbi:MAG: M48 family metalloprotease [Saprospiraceae bacterium]|nr:M48 family metalloprotease [Saprospiraceae bacterium]